MHMLMSDEAIWDLVWNYLFHFVLEIGYTV